MKVEMKIVPISCPICKTETRIELPVFLVSEAQDSMLKIQIPQEKCCPLHSFMVFIDKNFKVRGYQHADLEFNLKKKRGTVVDQPTVNGGSDLLAFDLHDLVGAIGTDVTAMILRTILVNKPVLFLKGFDLNEHALKTIRFLQEIESDDLIITSQLIDQKEMVDDKLMLKSNPLVYAVLYKALMHSPFPEKVKFGLETSLLKETMDIPDRQGQVAFLRRELVKLSRVISDLAGYLKGVSQVYEEDLPDFVQSKFSFKVNRKQVESMKEILGFKFGAKIAGKIKSKTVEYLL